MGHRQVSSGQKALMVTVVTGTVLIACIGFVGSYNAVLRLAQHNGFGWFSYLLPIGIDVGITVFLALDLLLTWMRIPLPVLRQLAWLLTAATIVFNAASAWPNPLSSGMHAVVPLLFVAAIEAARHTVGRIAQIEANQLFERTRLGRWIWAPVATLRLFRRRMLWELRSYEDALEMERRRLVYRARLRATYGRLWRHRAPVDFILLLKLANLGEPLPEFRLDNVPALPAPVYGIPVPTSTVPALPGPHPQAPTTADGDTTPVAEALAEVATPTSATDEAPGQADQADQAVGAPSPTPGDADTATEPEPERSGSESEPEPESVPEAASQPAEVPPAPRPEPAAPSGPAGRPSVASQGSAVERYRAAFIDYTHRHGAFPDENQLAKWLFEEHGVTGRSGGMLSSGHLRRYLTGFQETWQAHHAAPVEARQ